MNTHSCRSDEFNKVIGHTHVIVLDIHYDKQTSITHCCRSDEYNKVLRSYSCDSTIFIVVNTDFNNIG